ncbi:MAG: tRNA (cytidine(56)-2'-O)-methyltransferase [Methanoculleaceae archaeon]
MTELEPEVSVLRIGHRPERDQRVTTHVALTARALGARGVYLAGRDPSIRGSVTDVVRRWGGEFFFREDVNWRRCISEWHDRGGVVVHLTMYGLPVQDVIDEIRLRGPILVVVGAEKVPGEIFTHADYNVAVTNQPHSEIAALAVFLDRLFRGEEMDLEFTGGSIRVIPSATGKRAVGR